MTGIPYLLNFILKTVLRREEEAISLFEFNREFSLASVKHSLLKKFCGRIENSRDEKRTDRSPQVHRSSLASTIKSDPPINYSRRCI